MLAVARQDRFEEFLQAIELDHTRRGLPDGAVLWQVALDVLFRTFEDRPAFTVLMLPEDLDQSLRSPGAFERARGILEQAELSYEASALIVGLERGQLDPAVAEGISPKWVLASRADAEPLIAGPRSRKEFARFIRDRMDLRELSPYQTKHAAGGRMFFGRERHVQDLLRRTGENYAIVGPRRIGKSSLVRAVDRRLRAATAARLHLFKDRYLDRVAYVDCNGLGSSIEWEEPFFDAVLRSLGLEERDFQQVRLDGKRIRGLSRFELFERLHQKYRGVTLILDEVDPLLRLERQRDWPLFRKIQYICDSSQQRRGGSGPAAYNTLILAGFTELRDQMANNKFPFFGRLAEKTLSNLDRDEVEKLVKDPLAEIGVRIENTDDVITRIMLHTGGMPSVVQELCGAAVVQLQAESAKVLTSKRIEQIIETRAPLADYLRWLDYGDARLPRLLVYFAAPRRRFDMKTFAPLRRERWMRPFSTHDLEQALDELVFANIFKPLQPHDTYEFTVEAFRAEIAGRVEREPDLHVLYRRLVGDERH